MARPDVGHTLAGIHHAQHLTRVRTSYLRRGGPRRHAEAGRRYSLHAVGCGSWFADPSSSCRLGLCTWVCTLNTVQSSSPTPAAVCHSMPKVVARLPNGRRYRLQAATRDENMMPICASGSCGNTEVRQPNCRRIPSGSHCGEFPTHRQPHPCCTPSEAA
jgi:hypothetical protein